MTKNCADNGHHTCHQRRRGIQPLHRWLCTVYSHARCRFPGHEARRTRRTTPFSREETILPQIRPWQVATHLSHTHVRIVTHQVDATTPTPRQPYRTPLYLAADESGGALRLRRKCLEGGVLPFDAPTIEVAVCRGLDGRTRAYMS